MIVAPVMNTAMWNRPAVQRKVQRLRGDGMYVTFWRGALGVMHTLVAAMNHHRRRSQAC